MLPQQSLLGDRNFVVLYPRRRALLYPLRRPNIQHRICETEDKVCVEHYVRAWVTGGREDAMGRLSAFPSFGFESRGAIRIRSDYYHHRSCESPAPE